jgi:predicted solute-binding protein
MHHDELAELSTILIQSRDAGVAHVEQIARDEHARFGISYDDCITYLRDHLHFTLGPRELAGLRLFEDYSRRYALIPPLAGTKPGPGALRESPALAHTGSRFAPG